MSSVPPKVALIDGFALIFRAYFAFFNRPLLSPEGKNISAIFGFFKTLFSLVNQYKPTHLAVAFESKTKTLREEKFPEYKAHRDKAPDDLLEQIPHIERILGVLGIPLIMAEGYEADDVMATLARECRESSIDCMIISGDKDLMQCVGGSVKLLKPEKKGYSLLGPEEVQSEKGVTPGQIIDYLALVGDTADNVPGVAGIGPKTAAKLLSDYGTLEGIYNHLDDITSKSQKTKLEENRENAFLSQDLVVLEDRIGLGQSWQDIPWDPQNLQEAAKEFQDIGSASLVDQTLSLGTGADEVLEQKEQVRGQYEAITDLAVLQGLVKKAKEAGAVAFDLETDSLDPMSANMVGFSFTWESARGYYVPLKDGGQTRFSWEEIEPYLQDLLLDESVKIIGQNIKYDWKVLHQAGLDIPHIHFDTMVAAWMLESNYGNYGMDDLAETYLGYRTISFKETVPKGKTFGDIPLDTAAPYAAEDADITFRLYEHFDDLLTKRGLSELFFDLEMPLLDVLCRMEAQGIRLDTAALEEYSHKLGEEMAALEKEVWEMCGEEFNLSSTKQLQKILFEDRKLTPIKKTKTGYSTDSSVLEILAKEDPVPEKILRYRLLTKLKSTYVDALPTMVNSRTKKLHTSFFQTGTATGRLSSKDPNLQNIPIKDEEGRKIREAFVADPGKVFVTADYSQIELVVLAHLSGDPGLSAAFREGKDIHSQTAALVFQVFEEMVTPEQRRMAKAINFGIMYGMSAFRLSNELGIPRKQASEFIEAYFKEFSRIKAFIDETVKSVETEGKVKTMLGHERPIPTINSRNKTEKMAAERIAINTPIQGSAADIVKLAMLRVYRRLLKDFPGVKILLQVHDELLLECPEGQVDGVSAMLKEEMEQAIELSVPLRVNVESGKNWGQFH
jgi:DNA polymerase-1